MPYNSYYSSLANSQSQRIVNFTCNQQTPSCILTSLNFKPMPGSFYQSGTWPLIGSNYDCNRTISGIKIPGCAYLPPYWQCIGPKVIVDGQQYCVTQFFGINPQNNCPLGNGVMISPGAVCNVRGSRGGQIKAGNIKLAGTQFVNNGGCNTNCGASGTGCKYICDSFQATTNVPGEYGSYTLFNFTAAATC